MPQNNIWRYWVIAVVIVSLASAFLYAAGLFGSSKRVTAQSFVNLQEGDGAFRGFRRAHAKGICVSGEFQSSGALAPYSVASVFRPASTEFIGRFSIAGNNPLAPDLKAPVRSLALAFVEEVGNEARQQWRLAMNTPPVMAVSTPEDFYEQLVSLSPDPKTGKRDPARIKAFFAAHPESKDFNEWRKNYKPTNSFADETYNSINAFYLIDENGQKQAVRWQAIPNKSADDSLDSTTIGNLVDHADALQLDLMNKLKSGSVKFDLIFTFADSNDDENNPAVAWPKDRKTINAGTINIMRSQVQSDGACNGIRFDPLILPSGIEPTQDPILNARSASYAESYRRRAWESFLEKFSLGENK